MHKIYRSLSQAALAGALLVTGFSLAGCDHALFGQDDREIQSRLPYFDGATSAQADREARRENQNIGFGYPTGPSGQ